MGGTGLKLVPHPTIGAGAAGMLSSDGRCKTFDARANGYVRTEGVGSILVSPSSDDSSVVSSAVRQDGRSASLTAPNGSAQRSLVHTVWALGAVFADEIGCIEAHGTGTALGDPTEAGSLAAAIASASNGRLPLAPSLVGAAKASLGHSEAPSGLVGLLKAYRMLMCEAVAAGNAHLRAINPLVNERVSVSGAPVGLALCATSLRVSSACGTSSFGFSGTIAHVLLTQRPLSLIHI